MRSICVWRHIFNFGVWNVFLIVVIIRRWTISRVFIFVKGEMNVPAGTPLTNLPTLPYMLISG